jgi:hypothetical protein
MEPINEMDDLLKHSMQFDANEIPEPDPEMQKRLRKKVEARKRSRFTTGILNFLNMDIKLYHAGLAMAIVALLLVVLRHPAEAPKQYNQGVILADTSIGTSLKDDTFLVKNFSARIN